MFRFNAGKIKTPTVTAAETTTSGGIKNRSRLLDGVAFAYTRRGQGYNQRITSLDITTEKLVPNAKKTCRTDSPVTL